MPEPNYYQSRWAWAARAHVRPMPRQGIRLLLPNVGYVVMPNTPAPMWPQAIMPKPNVFGSNTVFGSTFHL